MEQDCRTSVFSSPNHQIRHARYQARQVQPRIIKKELRPVRQEQNDAIE
jgi:hypothetical protein